MNTRKVIARILDANLNRCREGLRVCEEVVRFGLNDRALSARFKSLRHALTRAACRMPIRPKELASSRDTAGDVGRSPAERQRRLHCEDIFLANMQRVKEALRVLEEFSRAVDSRLAAQVKRMRFRSYELEKKVIGKFPSLSGDRQP